MPKVSIQGGRKRKHLRAKKEKKKNTTGDTSHSWAKQKKIPPEIKSRKICEIDGFILMIATVCTFRI